MPPPSHSPRFAIEDCPAYILAGGKSSRFGSDKALVRVQGEVLLPRLRRQLVHQGHAVFIIADRRQRYRQLHMDCLVDQVPDRGPLAALATALQHRRGQWGAGWSLLLSCDQIEWQPDWYPQLANAAHTGLEAITFWEEDIQQKRLLQPLPGLYHTCLLPAVETLLRDDPRGSLRQLIEGASGHSVLAQSSNPRAWSFNTTAELAQRRHLLEQ
ncbi:MAG: molybdenum cofactor guanylyltransferase [Planctomycetales bacterium]|nr:molybdenum cofactor guanylyltransferase [Planctomycetales bacterium]